MRTIRLAIPLLSLLPPVMVIAQTATPERPAECPPPAPLKHEISQHAFIQSPWIPWAFSDSAASIGLILGTGTFSTGIAEDLELGAFSPRAEGRVTVLDRGAITFAASGNIVVGLNTSSAARYGASTALSWQLGALYELVRSEKTVLSAALEFEKPRRIGISPIEAARSALSDLFGGANPTYVSDRVSLQWRPSVRVAHALSRTFGLQGAAGLRLNTLQEGQTVEKRDLLTLGAAIDADVGPIGLVLSYFRGQPLSSEANDANGVSIGLYEAIGDATSNVGLEVGVTRVGGLNTTLVALLARMYFN